MCNKIYVGNVGDHRLIERMIRQHSLSARKADHALGSYSKSLRHAFQQHLVVFSRRLLQVN